MRILHFSDFHLNGEHIDEAKFILDDMKTALAEIKSKHKIDLVLFSGDMLDQGGRGFDNLKHGFEKFHKVVITPIMEFLDLSESHFIFTPGNHDIDRNADNRRMEKSLEEDASTLEGIIELTKASDVKDYTKK